MPEKCHLQTDGPWPNFQIVEAKYKVADIKGIVLAAFLTTSLSCEDFPFLVLMPLPLNRWYILHV